MDRIPLGLAILAIGALWLWASWRQYRQTRRKP